MTPEGWVAITSMIVTLITTVGAILITLIRAKHGEMFTNGKSFRTIQSPTDGRTLPHSEQLPTGVQSAGRTASESTERRPERRPTRPGEQSA